MLTPLEKYKNDLLDEGFIADPAQQAAVIILQKLFDDLIKFKPVEKTWFGGINSFLKPGQNTKPKSLYFFGGVGRGKTRLVDCFYDCLPFENKLRIHFHRFMQNVHKELRQLKNVEYPLKIVADRLARSTRIVCFDEFHVSDITDAMLLAGLLEALFEKDLILVATSNHHPDDLYKDGLQRERFLPAIALIKAQSSIVNIDSGIDYRLRFLEQAEIYHSPLDDTARAMLANNYAHVCPDKGVRGKPLEIEGRLIQTVYYGSGVVWFDFMALCDGPRGVADYIEIARQFQTVLLADIPILDDNGNDITKRLITLIDVLYDRNVKVIITAEAQPEKIYTGSRLQETFQRTISRLEEMRTHDYLSRQHLP